MINGINNDKIDLNIVCLKISFININIIIRFIYVPKGAGIIYLKNNPNNETNKTYVILSFLVDEILKSVVNSNIDMYASKNIVGNATILVNISFSVVKLVHIVCNVSIMI